jgi:hypothetical protein
MVYRHQSLQEKAPGNGRFFYRECYLKSDLQASILPEETLN